MRRKALIRATFWGERLHLRRGSSRWGTQHGSSLNFGRIFLLQNSNHFQTKNEMTTKYRCRSAVVPPPVRVGRCVSVTEVLMGGAVIQVPRWKRSPPVGDGSPSCRPWIPAWADGVCIVRRAEPGEVKGQFILAGIRQRAPGGTSSFMHS